MRVATLKRLASLGDQWKVLDIPNPRETLRKIKRLVSSQAELFIEAYEQVKIDLAENKVKLISESEVPTNLKGYLKEYFRNEVSPHIFPIILKSASKLPQL